MLRKYPESLRWRQAVPAGFVAALVLLTVGSVIAPAVWRALAVVLAIYGATVAGSAVAVSMRERDWPGVLPLIAAFTVVHVAWGTGFLLNLLTSARWPYRVPVTQPRESTTSVV
jgi:hypothetical protein